MGNVMETKSQERLINLMLQAGVEWPQGAEFAAISRNGSLDFSFSKPTYRKDLRMWSGDWLSESVDLQVIPNWHQTIITREMWEARDGWITWYGGECPVDGDVTVETRFSDGSGSVDSANAFSWDCDEAQINSYRIHKPAEIEQSEPCESMQVEPTIDELIAVWRDDEAAIQTATDKAAKSREAVESALARAGWRDDEPALLNITDWRDLKVGDVVEYVEGALYHLKGEEVTVIGFDDSDSHQPIRCDSVKLRGDEEAWPHTWKFIRRPR